MGGGWLSGDRAGTGGVGVVQRCTDGRGDGKEAIRWFWRGPDEE